MVFYQFEFFWWFLGFYIAHEIVVFTLEVLNYQSTKKQSELPSHFRDHINHATFEKSKAYSLEKMKFAWVARLVKIPFFWALIVLGGFNVLDIHAANLAGNGTLTHAVLFCLFVSFYFAILGLPFRIYSTFVIEEKYGFNKTTPALFVTDMIKSFLVSLVIGVPLLYVIFYFMQSAGSNWWIWVWASLVGFQVLMMAIFPTFLAPIFNKFTPLEDGELKERIETLAKKIRFQISGIFTIDGSKRSGHSNAYFSGIGRFRRIVLFDTLRKQLSDNELVAVLAHEMGHNVKKHIIKSIFFSMMFSFFALFVMSLLMQWSDFYHSFNIPQPSVHTAFVIFAIASEVFTFFLTPVGNLWSRHNEYEADRFAVETTGEKEWMKGALITLSKENLSNLTPHPAYSFYHYSHPTTWERIQAIDKIK